MHRAFISIPEYADLAGISRQAAWKACKARNHHGALLDVREIKGRGDKSGWQCLIKVSSLQPYLQDRLKALQTPVEGRSTPMTGSAAARQRSWWIDVLSPVMEHPKGSAERKAAYDEIAGKPLVDWNGRRIPSMSIRTLQRRMERMEGEGSVGPLARYGRADKGSKRTFISRAWDAAVPFDDTTKAKLAEDLKQEIRGLIVAGIKGKNLQFFCRKILAQMYHRLWLSA